jgi:Rrf2 family nitric oxide-sensitive transcriptional repressor
MKIVTDLGRQGVLETTRGRGGGLRLLKDPVRIRVGDVVRASETDFRLVECFDPGTNQCTLSPSCRLKGLFRGALGAYFRELDSMTLADIVEPVSASARTTSLRGRAGAAPVAPPRSLRKSARTGKSDA